MAPNDDNKNTDNNIAVMDSEEDDMLSVGSGDPSTVGENELPPLGDRKCFLTCLACILVSSYKYDVVEEDASHLPPMMGEDELNTTTDSSVDEDCDIPNTPNEVSMFLEEEEVQSTPTAPIGTGVENNNNNSKNNHQSRWRRRFGRNSTGRSTSNISDVSDHNNENDNSNHNGSVRGEGLSASSTSRTMNQRKRLSKAQKKLQLAAIRHRRRRHVVADQFLRSSCELLLLDKDMSDSLYRELEPKLLALRAPRIVPAASSATGSSRSPLNKIIHRRSSGGSGNNSDGSGGNNNDEGEKSDDSDDSSSGETKPTPTEEKMSPEAAEREARQRLMMQQYLKQYEWMTEYDPELEDHLPGLPPGAGYRCVCWLLFQHLLNTKRGYDARVRYALKNLAVAVLVQDIERTLGYFGDDRAVWKAKNYTTWVSFATRKFEQVEAAMAERLLKLARSNSNEGDQLLNNMNTNEAAVSLEDLEEESAFEEIQVVSVKQNKQKLVGARKHLVRGLKIGGVGVVAGTLLAVTGGMAAPAIAGALTFMGLGAVAGTFLTLASTSAVVHLFGVAGGSLAAYKMKRRTAGLTEFNIVQSACSTVAQKEVEGESSSTDLLPGEKQQLQTNHVKHPRLARWKEKAKAFKDRRTNSQQNDPTDGQSLPTKAELSRTICISGWLGDKNDFQRPWGISLTHPPASKLEKLQRFYRIYNPDLIPVCNNLIKRWKKEESTFWELLEDKYGCNPDTLFPLRFGPMYDAALTQMELQVLDTIVVEVGEVRGKERAAKHAHLPAHVKSTIVNMKEVTTGFDPSADEADDAASFVSFTAADDKSVATLGSEGMKDEPAPRFQRQCYASVFEQVAPSASLESLISPAHLATVWDFSARYGGEVYSLHWESHVLSKLCQCFREVALSATAGVSRQALGLMVANTVYLAATVPIYLVQFMNSIDETWTVVVSRAEEAGQELARSLLINNAGHRPVTLMGYSFGARVIFSCLKQLLVYQQQWEEYHEQKSARAIGFAQQEEGGKQNQKEKKWMLAELEFEREPASVVEDVVLMGAPMYLSLSSWRACRQVVAGRFVNVYSRTDKILSLMFKYKQLMESFKPVCGNCTVAVPGVENIDISDLVSSHQEYVLKVGDILKRVRHGQPIRSSSNALDEVALIAEAAAIAKQQKPDENTVGEEDAIG